MVCEWVSVPPTQVVLDQRPLNSCVYVEELVSRLRSSLVYSNIIRGYF